MCGLCIVKLTCFFISHKDNYSFTGWPNAPVSYSMHKNRGSCKLKSKSNTKPFTMDDIIIIACIKITVDWEMFVSAKMWNWPLMAELWVV